MPKISRPLTWLIKQAQPDYRKTILSYVDKNTNGNLLDCGCADGEFTTEVAQKIGTKNLAGIEIVPELVLKAKEKGINVYSADLNSEFPINNEMFDIVIANQIIEHLYDTDKFAKEIYRILKKGGYAVISTPNLASWHNIFILMLGKQPPTAYVSSEIVAGSILIPFWSSKGKHFEKEMYHLRIFTLASLKEFFEYHGFKVEKCAGNGYYPFPIAIARLISKIDKGHSAYLTVKIRKN